METSAGSSVAIDGPTLEKTPDPFSFSEAIEIAESLVREKVSEGQDIGEVVSEISQALSRLDVLAVKTLAPAEIKAIDDIIARLEQLKKFAKPS